MKIKIKGQKIKSIEIKKDETADEILKKLKIEEVNYLIILNGRLATSKTKLKEGDTLEFLNVVSGG